MNLRTFSLIVLLVLASGYRASSDQPAPAITPTLEVVNESGKAFIFSVAELAKLPQKEIEAKDHKGDQAKYNGVLLASVLAKADVTLGAPLKGKLLANYLVVEAADKYRVVFSLPEVDPEWTDNVVLLATSRNGEPLDAAHGPFQIVAPQEKRHSRWVKQVVRLVVRTDSK
jgi:DMSO/TMAO reductase YedYZ molybdopterin-dependent catalytic subunit